MWTLILNLLKALSFSDWCNALLVLISAGLLRSGGKILRHLRVMAAAMARLPATEKTVDEHGKTLEQHGKTLTAHTELLQVHGQQLDRLDPNSRSRAMAAPRKTEP